MLHGYTSDQLRRTQHMGVLLDLGQHPTGLLKTTCQCKQQKDFKNILTRDV
jgi:hypothetical protein